MWDDVEKEIAQVVDVCHKYGTAVKVIIETDSLTKEEIIRATKSLIKAEADFVKSSTGFFTGVKGVGATKEVVEIMIKAANNQIKVKGSGGIRTQEHFFELIDMGIDRMGIGYKSTPIVLGIK